MSHDEVAARKPFARTKRIYAALLLFALALGCYCALVENNGKYTSQHASNHRRRHNSDYSVFKRQQPDARFAIGVYKAPPPEEVLSKYRTLRTQDSSGGTPLGDILNLHSHRQRAGTTNE